MISEREYLKRNWYRFLVTACGVLALVALVHGIWTKDWRSLIGFAMMLGIGALIQWQGEAAYSRYRDSVNRRTDDDLN